MQLRNSLTGLVVTPNQFERANSILRSISAMLSVSSRTGSRVPPPANAEMSLPSFNSFLNDLLLQPLPEQQQEETATEASISSPEVTSDAAPVPKRRKRQLTEAEVKENHRHHHLRYEMKTYLIVLWTSGKSAEEYFSSSASRI